jgi:uncharacterized protein (TIGR03790 family)
MTKTIKIQWIKKLFFIWVLVFQPLGNALEPEEILVIANRNVSKSMDLALYYMEKRGIPDSNLLTLWVTDKEICSHEDYHYKIVPRVRQYLEDRDKARQIRCMVTVYGIPLKISPPGMTREEKRQYELLAKRREELNHQLKGGVEVSAKASGKALKEENENLQKQMTLLAGEDQRAALDSELALVKIKDYDLKGWIPNPHFMDFKLEKLSVSAEQVLMVSRLDGPDPEIVRRIIDDSLEAEKTGLSGAACIDARWPRPMRGQKVEGYAFYDRSLHLAADYLRGKNRLQVVLDDQQALFQEGQCANTALYCGWYSLGKYVDAFTWQKGAVGYHIASSECTTLRKPESQVWCKRMLEEGVAATLGPTSEPYVQGFPVPDIFFGLLADGRLGLAECYFAATPYLSWQMVLIGDPLYRPFH